MKTLEMSKATAPLADYARDVDKEPVIVTEHGRPVAALMPIRRRSPPENTLKPDSCHDFVTSSISSSGTLTALIAAGSAW